MQIWTFSKHHTFKYDFWEKTQYSNMNLWCFLVTPVKRFVEQHFEITELGIGTGHPNGFVLYLSAPLVVPALIGLQQLGHEPEEHIGRRAGALLL